MEEKKEMEKEKKVDATRRVNWWTSNTIKKGRKEDGNGYRDYARKRIDRGHISEESMTYTII